MNLSSHIMSFDMEKAKQENCNCASCTSIVQKSELKSQNNDYPELSEEEIEQIISERYSDKDEKTKTFIRKVLRKHGDKYDYSNVVYVKASEKIEIICRVESHKPFLQTPSNHLNGQGCFACNGTKKLTKEEFIKRANEIHECKYNYSKVEYKNYHTKVIVICEKHGEFLQAPRDHLNGRGCLKCAREKQSERQKLTLIEFIKQADVVHGIGKYDYSESKYVDSQTPIKIICKNHGSFWQTPKSHLQGHGCRKCYGNYNLTLDEFIKKANEVHHYKYDYSKVNYTNMTTKIEIVCPKHGKFNQLPNSHLYGYGCQKCAREYVGSCLKLTLKEFIEKARKIHQDKYDYSKVKYIDAFTKVCIICSKHGKFYQNPSSHLNGKGCLECAKEIYGKYHKLELKEFIEKANIIHNYFYDYSKVNYVNCDIKVEIVCPKHGSFLQAPYNHLKGQNCPKCNSSKGEMLIRKFLIENKIKFEEQKIFNECKYKRFLPFDFYLSEYNLCIEYDGIQHFEKVNWSGKMLEKQMEESLQECKFRDEIKTKYCKDNSVNLLRIKYNENVEEKLALYFKNHEVIKEQTIFDLTS